MSETGFRELIRGNDAVLLSFAEALLKKRSIEFMSTDFNMSVREGSIGILQRRLPAAGDQYLEAIRLMKDAGLTAECAIRKTANDGEVSQASAAGTLDSRSKYLNETRRSANCDP